MKPRLRTHLHALVRTASTNLRAVQVLTAATQPFREALSKIVNGRASWAQSVLDQHGKDESYHTPMPPDIVVFPETSEEISQILRACNRERVPVIPFGAGSSVEGHVMAVHGGVCLDMTRMDRILEVHEGDMDCRVQAGVTRTALNSHLRDMGLFFSVDPGADATMGGMAATRASGTNSVRYGTMRDNVMGLKAVMADGSIIRAGGRTKKSSSGYDLTKLLIGSEGTLGVITELVVRVWGEPEARAAAVCTFASLDRLVACATSVMQLGIPVAKMEMLDDVTMRAVNRFTGSRHAEAPSLFFEFHGSRAGSSKTDDGAAAFDYVLAGGAMSCFLLEERARHGACMRAVRAWELKAEQMLAALQRAAPMHAEAPVFSPAGVAEQSEAVGALVREEGGSGFEWAASLEQQQRLWKARHEAYWASLALRKGAQGFPTDVCVPISRLAECVTLSKALVDRKRILAPIVGHVGDGNFHMMAIIDPQDPDEVARAEEVVNEMVALAQRMGGTCSGEHGVGLGKLKHLQREHGPEALKIMHAIKRALDPHNILNPGKMGSAFV